ncbi:MAG TPA: hypothetical protein VHZ03_40080 [Trebonia sp.]|jgi:hypothetical protein|nr:hypothetical protein [Trebonia sp.]
MDDHLWSNGFVPRISARSRAGFMQAVQPRDLFSEPSSPVATAIVDARLASGDRDFYISLREAGVSMIVDTQAWRFGDSRTWKSKWSQLPYAPSDTFMPTREWVYEYVLNDLRAQVEMGCSCLLLPGWFATLDDSDKAHDVAGWTVDAFKKFRRAGHLIPSIAWLPASLGSAETAIVVARIYSQIDHIKALYVQFNRVYGNREPLDRLQRSARLMLAVQNAGLPVIAGHWGAVGLALRAVGITAADCGPSESQTFDISRAISDSLPRDLSGPGSVRGQTVRTWVPELGQTLTKKQMAAIQRKRIAQAQILCRRPCHRYRLELDTMSVAAQHGIICMAEEAKKQAEWPTSIKIDMARRTLEEAKSRASIVDSALANGHEHGLQMDHFDVQLAFLAGVSAQNIVSYR